jgi:hypothetical protein
VARQNQLLEVIAAERRLEHQRMAVVLAGQAPLRQLRAHQLWLLPVIGLSLGYGIGVAMRYRMLPAVWYAASISLRLFPAALRWISGRN